MPYRDDKNDTCFNTLLVANYGQIDSEWMVNTLAASHKTGDTQMASYNFNKRELLLQLSNDKLMAFERPNIRINMGPFFDSFKTSE